MKKNLFLAFLSLYAIPLFSQKGDLGIGIILGNPTGITGKYWTGSKTAVAGSIGRQIGSINHILLNGDFLIHPWTFRSEQDMIKAYFGPGAGLGFISELSISLRLSLGAANYFHALPLVMFAELVPTLQFTGPGGFKFWPGGYLGLRWNMMKN